MPLAFDRVRAADLLKEKPASPFRAYDVASKAHRRWDLHQHAPAALLFCVAAERAWQEHVAAPDSVNHFMSYYVRAGINFHLAGQPSLADPILTAATSYDWVGVGLHRDSHMTEWAFCHLLQSDSAGNLALFSALFSQAVARCAALGWEFPKIHPHQESLLAIAIAFGSRPHVEHLARLVRARRPISRAARALLHEVDAFLASCFQAGV